MRRPLKLLTPPMLALALILTTAPFAQADPTWGRGGSLTLKAKQTRVVQQQRVTQEDQRQYRSSSNTTGGGGGVAAARAGRRGPAGPSALERRILAASKSSNACGGARGVSPACATAFQVYTDLAEQRRLNGLAAPAAPLAPSGGGAPAAPAAPPPPDPQEVALAVIARLQLPDGAPNVGPPPSANKWNMVAVGYPVWLWTDGATQLNDAESEQGLTVSLDATAIQTRFSMGDGTTVACNPASAQKWVRGGVEPGTPSPTCGYRYEKVSMKKSNGWKGAYTVTATTTWSIDWAAGGEAGTVTTTRTASTQIPVGELQAVQVR